MPIEKARLRNESLFELASAEALRIPANVAAFLGRVEWPWAALGKALTAFVEEAVARVPAAERIRGTVSPLAHLENREAIVVCEGAIIEPFAYVEGPAFIGPGATVRHGAYVRGSVFLCPGALVGHTTEAKGALLLPNAKAAHFAYVGDSLLGCEVNLGAGTKLANLRLDHGIVSVQLEGERIDSGLKKFGAVMGNRSQTGCNSVANPGTVFLPGILALPNSTSTGVVSRLRR